jgi:hypothetical protein
LCASSLEGLFALEAEDLQGFQDTSVETSSAVSVQASLVSASAAVEGTEPFAAASVAAASFLEDRVSVP